MTKYLPFILFTVMTNAAAQLMLKQGMLSIGAGAVLSDNLILKLLQIVFSPWVFAGLCMFVISMGSHLFVLSKVDLSFAYPFLSLAYVAVAVFAWLIFKEDLGALKIAKNGADAALKIGGIALICAGTILIAQSGHGSTAGESVSSPTLNAKTGELTS